MAKCDYCGSAIIFGGKRDANGRFCNQVVAGIWRERAQQPAPALAFLGFPWGLLVTPVQIGRNVYGIACPPKASKPSPQLENVVRMTLAANAIKQQQAKATAAAGKSS